MTDPHHAKAIQAPDLGPGRWIIIDEQTGEILDDAQGYGYKTPDGAHRGWAYKSMPKSKKRERAAVKRRVERFWRSHKALSRDIDAEMFYALKDGEEFTLDDMKRILEEIDVDLEGLTVSQLYRYY